MKKRILPLLLLLILGCSLICPAAALTPLDPDAEAGLTLYYQKDGKAFPDLEVGIYRVAKASPDGSFELVAPYASYPINIHGITSQDQWQYIAQTLWAYIVARQAQPDYAVKTDETGTACFTGLETGLYFVREVAAVDGDGTYIFRHFMVYLPTPQSDGSYDYHVEANPKCAAHVPVDQYTVTKLWQDAGMQDSRPDEVTVDLYQNGVLQDTQVLSEDNHWTYTWQVPGDDPGQWTVVERDVPDPYRVVIQQSGSTFSIINIRHVPEKVPYTGDSFTPLPWILLMCFSGMMLVILSLAARRRRS